MGEAWNRGTANGPIDCMPVRVKYSPSQGQAQSRIHLHRQAVRSAGNSSVGKKSMRRHEAAAASSTSRHFVVMRVRCLLLQAHSCPSCFSCVSSSHCSPPTSPLVSSEAQPAFQRERNKNYKDKTKELTQNEKSKDWVNLGRV